MASRPKSSGGYKRSVASERAVYMCAPPAPFITNPQRGAWLWRAPCEAGEAIANNDILLPVLRLRAQSRTEDFYRSPGRCEHALKKSWPEPRPFQDAYARQKRRNLQDRLLVLVSHEHHSAIRRRSSERFGEFIEFLG